MDPRYSPVTPFTIVWKIPFDISCRLDLLVMTSLSFHLSGTVFNFSHFWSIALLDMESWLTDFFFFPSVFCLLAPVVSDEKSAINLTTEDPLYVINLFSLTAFKIFFWQCDYMSGCGSLWVYPTWNSLSIMEINTGVFH